MAATTIITRTADGAANTITAADAVSVSLVTVNYGW